jgi:hypothetical protein
MASGLKLLYRNEQPIQCLINNYFTASIRPFRMTFKTDGTEAAIAAVTPPTVPAFAGADTANTGFCLDYQVK